METANSRPLTVEMLEAAMREIRDAPRFPCGSKERPHVVSPHWRERCLECGARTSGSPEAQR